MFNPTRIVTLATVGLLVSIAPALAHAHLKSSTPAAGSTVATPPAELGLTFSEGVNPNFTGAKVTGPDKEAVVTGEPTFGAGGDTTLVVPFSGPLTAGSYKVDWHALANDGHKTSGSYGFTVKP